MEWEHRAYCKHKRDIWCDRYYTEFILFFCPFNVIIVTELLLLLFLILEVHGQCQCAFIREAAPLRLKYWRIKAEVTISTFLYLQEFFTGAAILSERFRTLQICNVLDYIDDITARYNVNLKNRTEKNMPHCYEIYYIDGGGISYLKKLWNNFCMAINTWMLLDFIAAAKHSFLRTLYDTLDITHMRLFFSFDYVYFPLFFHTSCLLLLT